MSNAIIIPTLQPEEKLVTYVREIIRKKLGEVVVVNDGSTADKDYIFNRLSLIEGCTVLWHPMNKGKGAALKKAIGYIKTHRKDILSIVTVDADGQHSINDVERIIKCFKKNKKSLILGVRDFKGDTPLKSKIGNYIASRSLRIINNIEISDTQTGLRAIGREHFSWLMELPGNRYEYEINMIIYSKNISLNIETVIVESKYYNSNKGSHFNAIGDSALILFHMIMGFTVIKCGTMLVHLRDFIFFLLIYFFGSLILTYSTKSIIYIVVLISLSSVSVYFHNGFKKANAHTGSNMSKNYILVLVKIIGAILLGNLLINNILIRDLIDSIKEFFEIEGHHEILKYLILIFKRIRMNKYQRKILHSIVLMCIKYINM